MKKLVNLTAEFSESDSCLFKVLCAGFDVVARLFGAAVVAVVFGTLDERVDSADC